MSKKAIFIAAIIVVITFGAIGIYKGYLYKPARDISSEDASYEVVATQLVAEYEKNPEAADSKYLNRTIEVKGIITGVADSVIMIDSVVVCGFDKLPAKKNTGNPVQVKGRCIGYDELFGEVKLDQCSIKE